MQRTRCLHSASIELLSVGAHTILLMATTDIQPPRRHTALDDEIADTEQELKDVTLRRRLIWAGVYAIIIIEGSLIGIAVATNSINWYSIAMPLILFSLIGIAFGLGALYDKDSASGRVKLIELTASLQRLRIQKRELAIGRAKSKSAQFARYKESMPGARITDDGSWRTSLRRYRWSLFAIRSDVSRRNVWFPPRRVLSHRAVSFAVRWRSEFATLALSRLLRDRPYRASP